ncbi:hypothetical protein D3C72_131490 [compost metagenome]
MVANGASPDRGRFGIVADDLTGAADTGLQFKRAGLRTWVISQFPTKGEASLPPDVRTLSVNVDSRHLIGANAKARTQEAVRWLDSLGCRRFYKKIDSTLRGNWVSETAGMLGELGWELAVIAPAFPEAGRITVGGYQLVDGTLVHYSPYAHDPLSPVTESHLPTILEASGLKVGHLELQIVMRGWEAIAGEIARLYQAGVRLVSADATRREDLLAIAEAIKTTPYRILPVGSAGLAEALVTRTVLAGAELLGGATPKPLLQRAGKRPVLTLNGSANPVSLQQVRQASEAMRTIMLDVRQLLLAEDDALHQLKRQVLQNLLAGLDVLVTAATTLDHVRRDRALARDLGMTPWQLGRAIGEGLARLARAIADEDVLAGLVIAGGDTAAAVCAALPDPRLEILEEVLPAIPCLQSVGATPLRLVTKSGGFGTPDTLVRIAEHLRLTGSDASSMLRSR